MSPCMRLALRASGLWLRYAAKFANLLATLPGGHDCPGGGPTHDAVPGVLLLAQVREGAVEAGEAEAPRGELAAQDGRALLHADQAAEPAPAEAGGRVARARHEVEDGAADEAHGEGAAAVVDHSPRAEEQEEIGQSFSRFA